MSEVAYLGLVVEVVVRHVRVVGGGMIHDGDVDVFLVSEPVEEAAHLRRDSETDSDLGLHVPHSID